MAGKKTKKKSSAKPAKKKAAKAPAKKGAKKGAAKKAAPKKAAPKKAAAKKAAPAKAAPKKKPAAVKAAKAPKAPKESIAEPIEVVEIEAADQGTDAADVAAPVESKASLQTEILAMARQLYGDKTDEELLALDPNDIDAMDPSMFYELLGEKYGVEADPDNDYFGGFGGPIKNLIAFVESRWDGKTRKDTPMPPGDWLEEYVHPES